MTVTLTVPILMDLLLVTVMMALLVMGHLAQVRMRILLCVSMFSLVNFDHYCSSADQ